MGTITPEKFVEVWQKSSSVHEVANQLGMTAAHAAARACKYRKLGVNLKRMPRLGATLDIERLKRLADELAEQMGLLTEQEQQGEGLEGQDPAGVMKKVLQSLEK